MQPCVSREVQEVLYYPSVAKPLHMGAEVSWSSNNAVVEGREKAKTRDTIMGMLRQWEEMM